MSNYPSDFQSAAPGYDAVEPGVYFSIPPTLIALVVLAIAAAAILGWLGGRRGGKAPDATKRIYDKIAEAAAEAAKATQLQVPLKAEALRRAIEEHLGPVIKLTDGVSGPYHTLAGLLPGGHGAHGAGHGSGHGVHDDHGNDHAHGDASHGEHSGDAAHDAPDADHNPLRTMVINARNVVFKGGRPAGESSHPPGPAPEDQTRKLRAAVHDFYDHWSHKEARLKELQDARDALNRPGLSKEQRPA